MDDSCITGNCCNFSSTCVPLYVRNITDSFVLLYLSTFYRYTQRRYLLHHFHVWAGSSVILFRRRWCQGRAMPSKSRTTSTAWQRKLSIDLTSSSCRFHVSLSIVFGGVVNVSHRRWRSSTLHVRSPCSIILSLLNLKNIVWFYEKRYYYHFIIL